MNPYMRAAKVAMNNFMSKDWMQGWQWKIEIASPDAPADFDIYAKDVDLGLGSIDADAVRIGAGEVALPSYSSAGEITMTMRDDLKQTIKEWMKKRLAKVKNQDGTLNIPVDYVFTINIFILDESANKIPYASYKVFPTKIGSATLSRESSNQFYSFPIIFQKFMSVGNKVL